MEPLTLAATAIAATIMTKFWEKTGEKLSEELFEKSEEFYKSLKQKAPETASAIEKVPQNSSAYGQVVLEVRKIADSDVKLVEEMESLAAVAQREPNTKLQKAISEILHALQNQQPTANNIGKVADKIGLLVQGGTINIQNFSVD
jgi:cysteinyl-tRNA synthetase